MCVGQCVRFSAYIDKVIEGNFTDDKEAITSVGSELDHSVACGYRLLNLQITDY